MKCLKGFSSTSSGIFSIDRSTEEQRELFRDAPSFLEAMVVVRSELAPLSLKQSSGTPLGKTVLGLGTTCLYRGWARVCPGHHIPGRHAGQTHSYLAGPTAFLTSREKIERDSICRKLCLQSNFIDTEIRSTFCLPERFQHYLAENCV